MAATSAERDNDNVLIVLIDDSDDEVEGYRSKNADTKRKLESLKESTIDDLENRLSSLRIVDHESKNENIISEEKFQSIVLEMFQPNELVCQAFNIQILGCDLRRLYFSTRLNDQIINFYFAILNSIEEEKAHKCIFLNTFFYTKLTKQGTGYWYDQVKRWTNNKNFNLNLTKVDMIFVPIHYSDHWCLAVINFLKKQFEYYDSEHGENHFCLKSLRTWLQDEAKVKLGSIDLTDWKELYPKNIPRQTGSSDCGVFMCQYANLLSKGLPLSFTQKDISNIRICMLAKILKQT